MAATGTIQGFIDSHVLVDTALQVAVVAVVLAVCFGVFILGMYAYCHWKHRGAFLADAPRSIGTLKMLGVELTTIELKQQEAIRALESRNAATEKMLAEVLRLLSATDEFPAIAAGDNEQVHEEEIVQ